MTQNAETIFVTEEQAANFRLIDSTYPANDAQSVLLSLIQDKIEFLGFRIQAMKEKDAPGVQHLEKRVAELTHARSDVLQFLKDAHKSGKKVKINCNLHLELED